jgi:transposase
MDFIQPQHRLQVTFGSLEDAVEADNPVRLVDAFTEQLDLTRLGFVVKELKSMGRPAFDSRVLLKLYFYGYLNGLRTGRTLERECTRNTELQWLLGGLKPNYHTITDFRANNPKALRNTFKLFVLFLKDAKLVSGDVVAVDGTKFRAHNSKKNNFNPKKIERHLTYIDEKVNEYLQALDEMDRKEKPEVVKDIKEKIRRLKNNKIKYEALGDLMEDSGEPQISTTDPDSRALLVQGQVVEVCYNTQAAVDSQHKLVVATHTINRNDRNALSDIATEAKNNLGASDLTILADKGYHNGRQIQQCADNNIATIVAHAEIVNSNSKGTTEAYLVDKFVYNENNDTYTCPQGQTLTSTGTWHTKNRTERSVSYQYKKYSTSACKSCPVRNLCTAKADGRREIERSEFAKAVEENRHRYDTNKALYRKRQEINEHIFGTIKRKWGYNHTNLIGLEKVNGEQALIMTIYNFKRVMNILKFDDLLEKLKNWKPDYDKIMRTSFQIDLISFKMTCSFFLSQILIRNFRVE